MITSAEIALLFRVSELARRFGLKPSDAEATLELIGDSQDELGQYELSFYGMPTDLEKAEKYRKMTAALGCDGSTLKAADLGKMEDAVEGAITMAPRVRSY